MRGRKQKSPELKGLQGNAGHHRPLVPTTPFVSGLPQKPSTLDDDGNEEWDRLTTLLHGLLTPSDRGVLLCACDSYSQLMAANRVLQEHGNTYSTVSENGSILIRQRPEVRHREAARRSYQLALTELGCSPTAHGSVRKLPDAAPTVLTGLRRLLG